MKFKICHQSGDYLILEGETIKEVQDNATFEVNKRGWKRPDCWSEKLE